MYILVHTKYNDFDGKEDSTIAASFNYESLMKEANKYDDVIIWEEFTVNGHKELKSEIDETDNRFSILWVKEIL